MVKTSLGNFFENFDYLLSSIEKIEKEISCVKKVEPPPKTISINQAVLFLKEKGLIISISSIYKLTSSKSIPFKRFGNRLIFDVTELESWVQSKLLKNENDELKSIVKSASMKTHKKFNL
ncbi:helix-turn-helix domain-containing protein [Flavobacterium psychrophilum]|nr:helix-turn-helix domain-containing protein [Flavobacterium psychrophilum]